MVIDAEAMRVSDDRSEQGLTRMDDDVMDEQKRRRMTGKQSERRSLTHDEASMAVSKRQKREAKISAIEEEILNTVPEKIPDVEQAHKIYGNIRPAQRAMSIQASRMVEINKWRERGVVER